MMVVLVTMEVLGMTAVDQVPLGSPFTRSRAERQRYFERVCRMVVDRVWAPLPPSQLEAVLKAKAKYPHDNYTRMVPVNATVCTCKQGKY